MFFPCMNVLVVAYFICRVFAQFFCTFCHTFFPIQFNNNIWTYSYYARLYCSECMNTPAYIRSHTSNNNINNNYNIMTTQPKKNVPKSMVFILFFVLPWNCNKVTKKLHMERKKFEWVKIKRLPQILEIGQKFGPVATPILKRTRHTQTHTRLHLAIINALVMHQKDYTNNNWSERRQNRCGNVSKQ